MQCLFAVEEVAVRQAFFMLIPTVLCGSVFSNSSITEHMSELYLAINKICWEKRQVS